MRTRRIAMARAAWGTALLAASRSVLDDRLALAAVATVLGVRHLAQSVLTLWRPAGVVAERAWAVDAAHGVTMLGLAGASRRWRAAALADAAVAAAWAGATWSASRRDSRRARQEV